MVKVLFVCLGNICRSPSAEAVFRALVKAEGLDGVIEIDSAGTGAWHVGNPPDDRAQVIGRTRNYGMSDLRARQAVVADFAAFDFVLAMDESNLGNLRRLKPAEYAGHLSLFLDFSDVADGDVPDPYYGELIDYEHVFDLLEPAAKGLLDHICSTQNIK